MDAVLVTVLIGLLGFIVYRRLTKDKKSVRSLSTEYTKSESTQDSSEIPARTTFMTVPFGNQITSVPSQPELGSRRARAIVGSPGGSWKSTYIPLVATYIQCQYCNSSVSICYTNCPNCGAPLSHY